MLRTALTTHSMTAINTVMGAAPTWQGSRGHSRRIDYVCMSTQAMEFVTECHVDLALDIAPAAREDHWPVFATIDLDGAI